MVVGNNLNLGSAKRDESDSGSSNSRPKSVKIPDADGKHGAEEMTRPGKRGMSKSELEPTQPAAASTVTEKKLCVEFNISDSSDNVSIESASTSTPPITPVKLANAAKPKATSTGKNG